jgi:hypothetical protein
MYNNYKWHGRILEVRGDRGYVDPEVPTKTIKGSRTRYTNRNKTSDEVNLI